MWHDQLLDWLDQSDLLARTFSRQRSGAAAADLPCADDGTGSGGCDGFGGANIAWAGSSQSAQYGEVLLPGLFVRSIAVPSLVFTHRALPFAAVLLRGHHRHKAKLPTACRTVL